MTRKRHSLAVLVEVGFLLSGSARAELRARVVSPLVQVFPDSPAPTGESVARLEAARGEWEPFQIVLTTDGPGAVSARASALIGDAGRIEPPALYRVGYLRVNTPSSVEGHAGRWPDVLIPDVDRYVGEKRWAFPFALPRGETRAIWVLTFVPETTPPGRYRGDVTVEQTGAPSVKVPIELTVHGFVLPRTPSLPATFGFSSHAVPEAHARYRPMAESEIAPLLLRYGISALRHRVSLICGTEAPPWKPRGDAVEIDFSAYDAAIGPLLDGTADRGGPAEGARFAATDLRIPEHLGRVVHERYARAMVAHLRERGWLSRVFDYTFDEPSDREWAEVRVRAARIRRAAPEVPRLVTTPFTPVLAGAVDIWCPVVNELDDKPGNARSPGRAAYDARLAAGERLWWYQSCMSNGCELTGDQYHTGWPSLVVDAPAVSHRIFEWLTYHYRIGGELYYNTVKAYEEGNDPWREQHLPSGNGDGTLFYPGDPQVIGGRTPIPVDSVRLELIREGLEDYEYLRLHEQRFGRAATDAIITSVASRTWQWQKDGARLLAARHRLAAELDAAR